MRFLQSLELQPRCPARLQQTLGRVSMILNFHDLSAVPEGTLPACFDCPRMQVRHNHRPPALDAPGKLLNDDSDCLDVPQGESTHHNVCAPAGNGKAAQVRERGAPVQPALCPGMSKHLRAEI